MTITLEQIDELRKRANVSYEDAKEALEKCEGDMVEALVYLEKNKKFNSSHAKENKEDFFDKVKALIKKGNSTRFVIFKKEKTAVNLSVTISLIITVLAFHITLIGLAVALVAGYRFKFVKNNGEGMKVNESLDKMHEGIDNLKKKFAEDVQHDECISEK